MDIKNIDKKNATIGVLVALCLVLFLALVAGSSTSNCTPGAISKVAENTKIDTSKKLPALEVIKSAPIYGITLNTPVDKVNALLGQAPFVCRFNEQEEKGEEGQAVIVKKYWRCNHKDFRSASLGITAEDNKITQITRNGEASREEIENVLATLDLIKLTVSDLNGFSMNQSERSTVFRLNHKNEDNTKSSLSYRMQFVSVPDPANPPKHDGMLSVSLTR